MNLSSVPTLTEFDPTRIPFQIQLIRLIRKGLDYSQGVQEILCSGSVGSSKSLVAAHIGITHCILNPGAVLIIGRKTMPSLRDTLIQRIIEHLGEDLPYAFNKSRGIFSFPNGSRIIPFSWSDGNYKKARSYEGSAAIFEEITENDDLEFYHEMKLRVGRLNHVKEKFILSITNPDSPEHPAYKYFIEKPAGNVRTLYSKTSDNIFLPPSYIRTLEENLDAKMKLRMLEGQWIEIASEGVYYSYDKEKNFRPSAYKVDPNHHIHISFDFNIGEGKPLSATVFQHIDSNFHFFSEAVIHGARTVDALEELHGKGLFEHDVKFEIHGDATGRHSDTRSRHSDYSLIKDWLNNSKSKSGKSIRFEVKVPLSNPRVRDRHNVVNGQLCNSLGQRHVFVYPGAETLDEGLRLTKLKPGAGYIEDDSKAFQHITTAAGYGIVWCMQETKKLAPSVLR